jgi:hypothetical protein
MLFNNVPLYSRIMFIGVVVLQCFVAIMLLRWDAWKRYPVMSVYLTWQAVGGLAALLIACFGAAMPYFYTYYVVTILANLITFAVVLELYYKIFDPRIGLAAWGRRHVVIIILVSLAVAIALGLLLAARNGGVWTRTMATVNEVMNVALWAAFCILLIYSRLLGLTWRPRPAGIAGGFILYLTVAIICIFVGARFSLHAALIAGQVEMAADFLSLAWWLGVFWGEEKLPEAVIFEPVEEMMVTEYRRTMEEAARLL